MKKLLKLSIILTVISVFCLNFSCFAVESGNNTALTGNKTPATTLIEPNETKTTGEANTSNSTNSTNETATENTTTESETTSNSNSSTQVSSISSVDDNSLTTADIINIFLIAVCVILVLLAIAILIRLK